MRMPASREDTATHKNAIERPAASCRLILGTACISCFSSRTSLANSFASWARLWRDTRMVINRIELSSEGISTLTFWKKIFKSSSICKTASSSRMEYFLRHSSTARSKLDLSSFTKENPLVWLLFWTWRSSDFLAAAIPGLTPTGRKTYAANFAAALG